MGVGDNPAEVEVLVMVAVNCDCTADFTLDEMTGSDDGGGTAWLTRS